jgi:translation initiation factor IF-2
LAKHLKINIKNAQIAEAINLGSLKSKLAKKKEELEPSLEPVKPLEKELKPETEDQAKEDAPRIRARSKSAFAESHTQDTKLKSSPEELSVPHEEVVAPSFETEQKLHEEEKTLQSRSGKKKTSEELRREIFGEEIEEAKEHQKAETKNILLEKPEYSSLHTPPHSRQAQSTVGIETKSDIHSAKESFQPKPSSEKLTPERKIVSPMPEPMRKETPPAPPVKLGPTGRHINDLLHPKLHAKPKKEIEQLPPAAKPPLRNQDRNAPAQAASTDKSKDLQKPRGKGREDAPAVPPTEEELAAAAKKSNKPPKFKEFRDIKPTKKADEQKAFDARDRQGLRSAEDEGNAWRKKRSGKHKHTQEDLTIRPTSLKVRIPISVKDLADKMKLKASQLIAKLFMQGVILTLNDILEDQTTIQLLGQEFGCAIEIDTTEEERIRITDKSIKIEISETPANELQIRPPVVAFMGHVDHGKTSLIDTIRKSNRAAGEAGAITQHIGAFRCQTPVGDITILDTPGHEAFSAMRARGADVTDIVVLVVAGDEGMRQQTLEAIQHARAAHVTIVVAINKCDKPNFNADVVYRQLTDQGLLPETWGGQTITVNCSAVTGEGIKELLEMLALQAEVLELRASPTARARGTVIESEMHKGMGAVASVLVQNGTLKLGDALVFEQYWGRVKTMRDEFDKQMTDANPSTPVEITGLSGLPEAGQEFIVVKNEKEAREIAEARMQGFKQFNLLQKKKLSMENLFQQAADSMKKILNVILRADVQGSVEALKVALQKIQSTKAELNIIFTGVGEISESDVQLAAASKAIIVGFHTQIESHADQLVKQMGVQVRLHDIIYHAIDDVKEILAGLLEKIAIETEKGKAEVRATFKSSQHGVIAGCFVTEGSIQRNNQARIKRANQVVWKGSISSLKRVKEDVREVLKGLECGILLNNFNEIKEGDIVEAYEVTYITQEL